MCLYWLKNSLLVALLLCHYSHLRATIIITACSTQAFTILRTTATVLLELHTWLVTKLLELQLNWTDRIILPFIVQYIFSLMNVFQMEIHHACGCAFSYISLPNANAYRCWFRCSMYLLVCIWSRRSLVGSVLAY